MIFVLTLIISIVAFVLISQQMFDPNKLPLNYGKVDSQLFAKEGKKQPLLVYFGGSEGGNSMTKEHNISERKLYTDKDYAMLAIGYFGLEGIPKELDRISLDAIYEEIKMVRANSKIDSSCVAVMGGSKGAELALLLATKYPDINAVVSFAGSHVSFSSTSIAADTRTPSFNYKNLPVPYVRIPTKAIPYMLIGDFRHAHELAFEDKNSVEAAGIEVENIKGPILLISGEKDNVWPSAEMSTEVIERLKIRNFTYPYQHIIVPNGNHSQPQSDYHQQAIEFLDSNFLPTCDGYRPELT
jgi:dipeptidyl aminopeptidase/acylaminoacyl peptidase